MLEVFENGTIGFRFANGEECDVVGRNVIEILRIGVDVVQQKRRVGAREEKVDRRIGHEVARRHEGKNSEAGAATVPDLEVSAPFERSLLNGCCLIPLPERQQDHRQIQKRCSIFRVCGDAGQEFIAHGRDVSARVDQADEGGHPVDEVAVARGFGRHVYFFCHWYHGAIRSG